MFSFKTLLDQDIQGDIQAPYRQLIQTMEQASKGQQKELIKVLFPFIFSSEQSSFVTGLRSKSPFFCSEPLERYIAEGWELIFEEEAVDWKTQLLTEILFSRCTNKDAEGARDFALHLVNPTTGLEKYFRLSLNSDFVRAKKSERVSIPDNREPADGMRWAATLEADAIQLEGFVMGQFVDVSRRELLARLEEFMVTDESNVEYDQGLSYIQSLARSYFGNEALHIGSVYVQHTLWRELSDWTILRTFNSEWYRHAFEQADGLYKRAVHGSEVVFDNELDIKDASGALEAAVIADGYKSLLLAPVVTSRGDVLGLIEFASPKRGAFDPSFLERLGDFGEIFEMGMNSFVQEIDQQVSLVLQKYFTPIHTSLEWKFRQVALDYYWSKTSGESERGIQPIEFRGVWPLFGQLDVVSSSQRRKSAIVEDLKSNIEALISLLSDVQGERSIEIISSYLSRLTAHQSVLQTENLDMGEERKLTGIIGEEVNPVLLDLKGDLSQALQERISQYFLQVDAQTKTFSQKRSEVEAGVTEINRLFAALLSREDQKMQTLLPHYITHSLTDGIEFDLYVGQSLLRKTHFHTYHIKDFRLWQLKLVCQMGHEVMARNQEASSVLLPAISLLVVAYPSTIDIHFRGDEKRFDVMGAEGVRYETIKKRVEKAVVTDTGERLTQANKLAVCYLDEATKKEYIEYLNHMAKTGAIEEKIEDLELDLPTDSAGIKSLRVD
ncbi:MAG: GAF domain-containing protein, partial [Bacteroidota bacterium]